LEGPFFFFLDFLVFDEEDEAATDFSSVILSPAIFFSSGGGRKCDGVASPVVMVRGSTLFKNSLPGKILINSLDNSISL